ncbi:hypothetical protein ACHAWF_011069 [Thalassiosira exigua]
MRSNASVLLASLEGQRPDFRPDTLRCLGCYVDADFVSGLKDGDHNQPESVLLHTGFGILYVGRPITWSSKLQTEIAPSTTESEYATLLSAMREISDIFGLLDQKPVISKLSGRTTRAASKWQRVPSSFREQNPKHIAIKYHHFRQLVNDETIIIKPIRCEQQLADYILTKPLCEKSFRHLWRLLMGW